MRPSPARARDLYESPLFTKSLAYADHLRPDRIYILSVKHGLVSAEQVITPYEETLNGKSVVGIRSWADKVLADLCRNTDIDHDHFTILAGQHYRRFVVPHLAHVSIPLKGLGIGKQLRKLDTLLRERAIDDRGTVRVLAAVIRKDGRYLISRRPPHKRHGGLWEFPGGKIESGESDLEAAERELREELDVAVTMVGDVEFKRIDEGSVFAIEFYPVMIEGEPKAIEHSAHAWVRPEQLRGYELAPSDWAYVEACVLPSPR